MENAPLINLSRQMALRREMDVIANNLANMNTTGFKSEAVTFQEYLMPVARANTFPLRDQKLSYVEDKATWQNFAQGLLEITKNPFDMAIDGKGAFFVVQTPQGERYTRNGSFQLDATGQLVTNEGYPVMTSSGPISFTPQDGEISISADGSISTAQGDAGRLRIARFAAPESLQSQGSSLFAATSETPQEVQPGEVKLTQGALERSNVQPIREMSRMIEVQRAYQTLAGMMDRQDELRRSAIQQLGEMPS